MRKSDEEHILRYQRLSADRYDYKNDEEKEEMEEVYTQIEEWIRGINDDNAKSESASDGAITTFTLLLPPLNSHKRKLLYQEMARRYPSMILNENTQDNEVLDSHQRQE